MREPRTGPGPGAPDVTRPALLFACLLGAAFLAGCSGSEDHEVWQYVPDGRAPEAVTDLVATPGSASGAVDLTWTAVGDDGNAGAAWAYVLKTHLVAIDEANWDAAVTIPQFLVPRQAGEAESYTVTGLTPAVTCHFALKAMDEAGHLSPLSNSASAVPPSEAPDTTPPATVSDLAAATGGTGRGSIELAWTAPGDDGTEGACAAYVVKRHTSAITDANWDAATTVSHALVPSAGGTRERLTVTGLSPGSTHHFALRAEDEVPNVSGVSNSPQAEASDLAIQPGAVRVPFDETVYFTASGGEPPYTFSLVGASPVGSITSAGAYTAGTAAGSDQVRVTDADSNVSDADVTVFDPSSEPDLYRIVCTDYFSPASVVSVSTDREVRFQVENGTPPDAFHSLIQSDGHPGAFVEATRTGTWFTGGTGADDGSVVDILQVFDASDPPNVAVLKVYASTTSLRATPRDGVVPSSTTKDYTSTTSGIGTLTWGIIQNGSGGTMFPLSATSARYTPGPNTNGVYGGTDIIQVEDSFPSPPQAGIPPQIDQVKAVVPGLDVFPREHRLAPSGGVSFQAFGGSGSYTWTLVQNDSGGSPASGSGASFNYTAGTSEGSDILRLTDGTAGGQIDIPLVVCAAVSGRSLHLVSSFFPSSGPVGQFVPLQMAVDDFDGNGTPDAALPFSSSTDAVYSDLRGNQVALLLDGGTGGFQSSSTTYTLPSNVAGAWGVCSADFNDDGNRDLAVTGYVSGNAVVLFGDGTGGFPGTVNFPWTILNLPFGAMPTSVKAYDFDRSLGDDLVVCDGMNGRVLVYRSRGGGAGNPPGGFEHIGTLTLDDPVGADTVSPMVMDVAVANFDNDTTGATGRTGNTTSGIGLVDIAVTDYAYDRVVVFPAVITELASWDEANQAAFPVWSSGGTGAVRKPVGMDAGFFNGAADLYPDIVVANNGAMSPGTGVSVLINQGTAGSLGFDAAVEYGPSSSDPRFFWDVVARDLDNDGTDDVAATARNVRPDLGLGGASKFDENAGLCVWRGLGDGTFFGFASSDAYATRYDAFHRDWFPTAVGVIDFGGHVRGTPGAPLPDLVVANGSDDANLDHYGKLAVFENQSD